MWWLDRKKKGQNSKAKTPDPKAKENSWASQRLPQISISSFYKVTLLPRSSPKCLSLLQSDQLCLSVTVQFLQQEEPRRKYQQNKDTHRYCENLAYISGKKQVTSA